MKRILVPTDFSDPSLPSYKFAVDLAEKVKGEILVVHVISLPLLQETTFGIQPPPFDPELLNQLEKKAATAFKRFVRLYPKKVTVSFHTARGEVVPGIKSFIEQNETDLVVMGTYGASALDDYFMGSTAGKTARLSPVPVIAVPREISIETIKNIVFPNTLELDQVELLKYIKGLQEVLEAKLHVLLVNTPQHFYSEEQSAQKLQTFAEYYSLRNYTLNCRNHTHEESGIMFFMNEIKGDMLAMATHGRRGLSHLMKGSIAESLLYAIDQPIWTWKMNK